MLRPDKSVIILELKVHFPNYKNSRKKYFIRNRNQTECRNVTNQLTRIKLRLYYYPTVNIKQFWLCLLTTDASIKNVCHRVSTKNWKLKIQSNLYTQYKQEFSKEALRGSHQDLFGVIMFPCSNQSN